MSNLHPVHETQTGNINLLSGRILNLRNPDQTGIHLTDIANNLSKICRFGGAIKPFYSVAQHSVLVSALLVEKDPECSPFLIRAALLHDAAEAYLGDVVKPLKNILGREYEVMEFQFEYAIAHKFNFSYANIQEIKRYDKQALEIEFNYFFKGDTSVMPRIFNNGDGDPCWPHEIAAELFQSAVERALEL